MIGINVFAGLCNRLFQMSFGYAYARRNNTKFRLENWSFVGPHSRNNYLYVVQNFLNSPYYHSERVEYDYKVNEDDKRFTEYIEDYNNLPNIQTKNYLIERAFFQNEKYFKEYRSDIIDMLKEPEEVSNVFNTTLKNTVAQLDDYHFIHVRLGDFVHHDKHWVNLENYYIKAIEEIKKNNENPKFLLCSNRIDQLDIVYPRLKKYLVENIPDLIYTRHDEVITFYLMLRCRKGGICGNSTFSWWPSWLNENKEKEVYFPSRWMRTDDYNNNIDIYFEGSKIIDV